MCSHARDWRTSKAKQRLWKEVWKTSEEGATGREEGLQVDSNRASVVILYGLLMGHGKDLRSGESRTSTMVALLISGVLMRKDMFGICPFHI